MLFYCQILLNFQSAQALIQVRSLSNIKKTAPTQANLLSVHKIKGLFLSQHPPVKLVGVIHHPNNFTTDQFTELTFKVSSFTPLHYIAGNIITTLQ